MHRISIIKGDITTVQADAIVNAANRSLLGGGGVDGAIHRAGGPSILKECRQIVAKQGGCKTGEAVITGAGNLPAKYVIHTVGPVWPRGTDYNKDGRFEEDELLVNCYRNSLLLAIENGCKSIAFPNISTGVYAYPKARAAGLAVKTVLDFLEDDEYFEKVIFVCFDEENYELLTDAISLQILRKIKSQIFTSC